MTRVGNALDCTDKPLHDAPLARWIARTSRAMTRVENALDCTDKPLHDAPLARWIARTSRAMTRVENTAAIIRHSFLTRLT